MTSSITGEARPARAGAGEEVEIYVECAELLSPRTAVLSIHALTAVTGLAAILLYQVNETGAAIVLAQLLLVFAVITLGIIWLIHRISVQRILRLGEM